MKLSISEIINHGATLTEDDQQQWFAANDSLPLRQVLRFIYDQSLEILLPSTPIQWKRNEYLDVEGMLYKEARRLRIFIKGYGYDHLPDYKREGLWISLLADIDRNDAELLSSALTREPVAGISEATLLQTFPSLMNTKLG